MTTLNVYKGTEMVGIGESPVHINLEPATYPEGTFQGELVDDAGKKTEKFDFPAVTVKQIVIPVTNVTMNQATATGEVGKKVVLSVTIEPENSTEKEVTWTSTDNKIATVDNGNVTFVSAGTATITATVGDKSATTKLTIKEPIVAVTKVTLDPATASVEIGKTAVIEATIEPSNATDKSVTWASKDTSIATVADGTVTGVKAGDVDVTATSADGKVTGTTKVIVTAPADTEG
ncbi:Ig-like domain-containing protein [Companilactobacillus hulinensis]|uniref:Ig-like domain-containing protein n=1 Tax=Companilactobacillus hulinensis TaxID=2486007 RepID=UPI0013DDF463|nr:Ig-like domain-containing protein [Companilactobacillus hulinensis]